MGKSKKKSKHSDEFYESLIKAKSETDGGWSTGPAGAMDEDMAADEQPKAEAAPNVPSTSGKSGDGMQLDKPAGKKYKLGVAPVSLKRGQRSKAQRLRKVQKTEKAMARVDKVGVRVVGEQKRKVSKLALKHMYD